MPPFIEARVAHCSVVYNKMLYIFGGHSDAKGASIQSCGMLPFGTFGLSV